jgi:hypothetical protein
MSPEEREAHWDAIKLPVGHCSVTMDRAFSVSLNYWQSGELAWAKQWSLNEPGDLVREHEYGDQASVLVEGDCRASLSLASAGLIHIKGDLASTIRIGGSRGPSEIVIAGNIRPGAEIQTKGIANVFVGGDLAGSIGSAGALTLCIYGNMTGKIRSGEFATRIALRGDFLGGMEPAAEPGQVVLEVRRFSSYSTLEAIASHGYPKFDAAIGISDRPAGIYPGREEYKSLTSSKKYCCWIIHAQALDV